MAVTLSTKWTQLSTYTSTYSSYSITYRFWGRIVGVNLANNTTSVSLAVSVSKSGSGVYDNDSTTASITYYANGGTTTSTSATIGSFNVPSSDSASDHDKAWLGDYDALTITHASNRTYSKTWTWKLSHVYSGSSNVTGTVDVVLPTLGAVPDKVFTYTGAVDSSWKAPATGTYSFTVYGGAGQYGSGASGSGTPYTDGYSTWMWQQGGVGGKTTGNVSLSYNQQLYVSVGGGGKCTYSGNGGYATAQPTGGWNGGQNGVRGKNSNYIWGGASGGASAVYTALRSSGLLTGYASYTGDILFVAGGGGGGSTLKKGGDGGGTSGGNGAAYLSDDRYVAKGGTQSAGGAGTNSGGWGANGTFGAGGATEGSDKQYTYCGGAGGGGYYGGGGGCASNSIGNTGSGAGGSGYYKSTVSGGSTVAGGSPYANFWNASDGRVEIIYPNITVSYNVNSGSSSTPASTSKKAGQSHTIAAAATRNSTSSSTTYAIKFNVNGGTSTAPADKTGKKTTTTSYSFNGWHEGSASGTNHSASSTWNYPTANTTLYAGWTQSTSNSYDSVTLPAAPTRAGYTFNGWYTAATGGTKRGNAGGTYQPTAAETLYAQWTGVSYTVKYWNNGNSMGTSSHVYGTAKNLTTLANLSNNTLSGYTFYGWASGSNTSVSRSYTDGQSVSNLTTTSGGTVNLYSIWYRTATFYSGSSKGTTKTATQYRNTSTYSVAIPAAPTAISGWTALGWRADTSAAAQTFTTTGTIAGTTASTHGAQTFYAVYSRNATFYSNTSSSTTGTQYYNTNGAYSIPAANVPTPAALSGWTALGWRNDTSAGNKEYSSGTAITSSGNTYYAVYSCTATFYYGLDKASNATATQYRNHYGGNFTVTTPSVTSDIGNGWTALGWRDDTSAGARETAQGSASTSSVSTFYMVYSRTPKITYNANGGSGSMADTTATQYYNSYGSITVPTLTFSTNSFSKSGYEFSAWALGSTTGTQYQPGATINAPGDASSSTNLTRTAYAIWDIAPSIWINVDGTWKIGVAWIKVNGTWKKGMVWTNVNGTWKR